MFVLKGEHLLLENSLYAELSATLEEATPLAEASSTDPITLEFKKLFKRFKPDEQNQGGNLLTPEQLVAVRKQVYEKARQLVIPDKKAELLADAIEASMIHVEACPPKTARGPLSRKNFLDTAPTKLS